MEKRNKVKRKDDDIWCKVNPLGIFGLQNVEMFIYRSLVTF